MRNRFHFGKNWKTFMERQYSPAVLEQSTQSLQKFLGEDLQGKTFVDIGCGSGIHSLSALKLGASRVVSVDVDEDSVECTRRLRQENPEYHSRWSVEHISMLDLPRLKSLGTYDVVYCWGVAHHTGEMWKALDNLAEVVAPGGVLYVAIYNTLEGRFGSKWWHRIKKVYNHSSRPIQKVMEWGYISIKMVSLLLHLRNPFTVMRQYRQKRGMAYTTDLIDWLGGYPYEHAKPEEIILHYRTRHQLELVNLKTTNFIGCNEFLFRKP